MTEQVGLIGFGIMGAAMAGRLHEAGHAPVVHDASPEAIARARGAGYDTVDTAEAVARQAAITILSLPRPEQVVAVVRGGPGAALDGAGPGSIIVDTSTVDPGTSQENARAARRSGVGYLDCPILGRPAGVGRWTIVAGGEAEDVATATPLLETLATRIVHVGPSGHGNILKLLNNLMFGAINSITCEVFALGEQLGVAPTLLFETIADSGAATVSNLFRELGPRIVEGEFWPDFSIDNLAKDIELGLAMAQASGFQLPISEVSREVTARAQAAGSGAEDTAAVIKTYRARLPDGPTSP